MAVDFDKTSDRGTLELTKTGDTGRIIVFDPDLSKATSHNLSSTTRCCIAAQALGKQAYCVVNRALPASITDLEDAGAVVLRIGNNMALDPYRLAPVECPPAFDPVLDGDTTGWEQCLYILLQMDKQLQCTSEDVFFCHTVSLQLLVALQQWLLLLPPERRPRCHLSLYAKVDTIQGIPLRGVSVLQILERYRQSGLLDCSVFLSVETVGLQDHYRNHGFELPVSMGPIPISICERPEGSPVSISYLGEAREEKGFHLVPGIVSKVLEGTTSGNAFRFEIQTHASLSNRTSKIERAISDLKAMARQHDNLILHETLSPSDYDRLLHSSDLTLLPYDAEIYAARGSGVAFEALGSGGHILCSRGSDMAKTYHGKKVLVPHTNTEEEFAGLVMDFVAGDNALPEAGKQPVDAAAVVDGAFVNGQSISTFAPENFFKSLLGFGNTHSVQHQKTEPPAGLVYVMALPQTGGHGYVQRAHLKALAALGQKVVIVGLPWPVSAGSMREISDDFLKTYFSHSEYASFPVIFPFVNAGSELEAVLSKLRENQIEQHAVGTAEMLISHFVKPGEIVDLALESFDFSKILANYHWSLAFVDSIRRNDAHVVTEVHDFQAHQNLLRKAEKPGPGSEKPDDMFLQDSALETQTLRRSDGLVYISGALRDDIVKHGGPDGTILRPAAFWEKHDETEGTDIGTDGGVDVAQLGENNRLIANAKHASSLVSEDVDILFVGTGHEANLESLRFFVADVIPKVRGQLDCNVFVVGNIANKFSKPELEAFARDKVFFVGRSDNIEWWYRAAKVVNLCITQGTGFPTKVIETLAMGKCFTSTTRTFYDVLDAARSYFDVPETASDIAADLVTLLSDEAARKTRGADGQQMYQKVFGEQQYIQGLSEVLNYTTKPAQIVQVSRQHTELPGAAKKLLSASKTTSVSNAPSASEARLVWADVANSKRTLNPSHKEMWLLTGPRWLKKPGRWSSVLTDDRSLWALALRYPMRITRLPLISRIRRRYLRMLNEKGL